MTQTLNPIEISTIKDILNKGLCNAAISFSYFINEKLKTTEPTFRLESIRQCTKINYKQGAKFILKTRIFGEVRGASYLIFSDSDAQKLFEFAIPAHCSPDSEEYRKIASALLLELDNIVSASVVSQFDEILDCKIYGGIPAFENVKNNLIDEEDLSKDNLHDSYIVNVEFTFLSKNEDFAPDFFWILSSEFVEKVKHLIRKQQ